MSLADLIKARIRQHGPISVAEYMQTCLLHPTLGYYTTRDPLGAQGDFITAPEISQMFGELIGLALAQMWMDQGSPAPFTLAELGPGRGTLMADILRATAKVPGFVQAAQVTLVEASPALRKVQAATLHSADPVWLDTTGALPDEPLFLVANEFFDALPIRQFVRDADKWRERQIGVQGDALCFGLGPATAQPALSARLQDTADGDMIEDCPGLAATMHPIATRIADYGGGAILIDYGDWRSQGDTLQAVRGHESVDVLSEPGDADLTAHVDFEALAQAASPARHSRVTPQGVFLERLGITARAEALAATLRGGALAAHVAAHRRLTHPAEMGNLFKVLGLMPDGARPPPGLEI